MMQHPKISGRLGYEVYCPACCQEVSGFTAVDGTGRRPKPGDIMICFYCATPLQAAGDPLGVRLLQGEALSTALERPDFKAAMSAIMQGRQRDG